VQELTAAIVSYYYMNASQRSVATQLRCGGTFNNHVTARAHVFQRVSKTELVKLVNNWLSYGQKFGSMFSQTHSVDLMRDSIRTRSIHSMPYNYLHAANEMNIITNKRSNILTQ